MTRPIGPDGLPQQASTAAPHLATHRADGPRRTVSILRDLSPGQVRLEPAPAARAGRWKWMLPMVLAALVGGLLLGRQAPGPTPPAPAVPLADARPAPPGVTEPPSMPAAPGGAGGGAIIREPSPPPSTPGTPETTPHAAESVGAPPQALPHPPPARSAAPSPAKPSGERHARHSAPQAPERAAPPPPGQAAPGRGAERDVDIITAIVK